MDGIQPVGAMIQPQPANSGLNAYSTLLGIQQQKQALQRGQQMLGTETAQATIATQGAKENQSLAALLADPVNNGITDKDGNPTPTAFAKIQSVAPTTGAANYQHIVEAAKARVGFESDLTSLSDKQRAQVGSVLSADTAGGASRETSVQNLIQLAKDNPAAIGVVGRAIAMLPPTPFATGNGEQDSQAKAQHMQQLNAVRNNFGRAVIGPENAASLNLPNVGAQFSPKGILTGTAQSKITGELQPAGGGIQVGLGPTQTVQYQGAIAGAAAGAAAMQGGAAKIDVDTYNKALTAGAQSATVMDLSKRIEREAGEVRTGKFSQEFANRLTVFQQHNPGATATQMLQKDAANLKTMIEGGLVNPTDAERAAAGAGLPSPETMGPDALQKAARYWQGYAQMTGGRRDLALQHIQQTGSIAGYAARDSQYMAKASPGALEPKQTATAAQLADYARRKGISIEAARAHAAQHGVEIKQ